MNTLIWLSIKQVSERTVRRNIEKYKHRHVNGIGGKNGIQYEIALESLPPETQARHHGEQTTKDPNGLAKLTDAERDIAFAKQTIILSYQEFKATYPKADKLQCEHKNC